MNFRIKTTPTLSILFLIASAIAWGLIVLGSRPLELMDTSWLWGDFAVVYISWVQYLSDPDAVWLMSNRMSYPMEMNFAIFDPIPILLLLVAPFVNWVPEGTQWFGVYFILCVVAQALLGYLVIGQAVRIIGGISGTVEQVSKIVGGLFFILTPYTFYRFQGHTALSSHWIIVLGIWGVLRTRLSSETVWISTNCIILFLATGFNPYIAFMVGLNSAIFAVFAFSRIGIPKVVQRVLFLLATAFFGLTIFGFMTASGVDGGGYGLYSMNMMGPFDSNGYARILSLDILDATGQQSFEGFVYLGLGLIIMSAIVVAYLRRALCQSDFPILPALAVITISYLFALSSDITFFQHMFSIEMPEYIGSVLAKFRASGRLFWVGGFWLIVLGFSVILSYMSQKKAISLLLVLLTIQFVDVLGVADRVRQSISNFEREKFAVEDNNDFFKNYDSVVVFPPWQCDQASTPGGGRNYELVGYIATKHKLATNNFYAARSLPEQLAYHCDYNNIWSEMSESSLYILSQTHYQLFLDHFHGQLSCTLETPSQNIHFCSFLKNGG